VAATPARCCPRPRPCGSATATSMCLDWRPCAVAGWDRTTAFRARRSPSSTSDSWRCTWRRGDALGRRVRFVAPANDNAAADSTEAEWLTIVGVMPNIRQRAVQEVETDPVVYMPLRANPIRGASLLVRTTADPGSAIPLIREAMSAIEPDLPLFDIMTMDQFLEEARWPFCVFGLMFSVFAGIALVLSAVGLYSVTAHSVTQRTSEIGIRVAHGAQPRQVTWLVLRRALIQLGIGLPIGLLGAVFVG